MSAIGLGWRAGRAGSDGVKVGNKKYKEGR